MSRKQLVKLVVTIAMFGFGIIVALNWFHIAEGEPGWVGWMVIVLSPPLYPAMAWMLMQRFFPDQ